MTMTELSEWIFWFCLLAVAYPYAMYPLLLIATNRLAQRVRPASDPAFLPTLTVICPVHNEAAAIEGKVRNLLSLDYPRELLQICIVGDGCTDDTLAIADRAGRSGPVQVIALPGRAGKAAALNAGLAAAKGEILVFTDVAIRTEPGALRALCGHFADRKVGCVSGEDWVEGGGTEGLYGRLELLLRREESRLHSIAGASGCLYAVRRQSCRTFAPGMAPDFLSVLEAVRSGYRALCEPEARGTMAAARTQGTEFVRKRRTYLRGITALAANLSLLNPIRYPAFSFILFSHKLMRWMAPVALAGCLVTAILLRDLPFYEVAFYLQLLLYLLALSGLALPRLTEHSLIIRVCAFFLLVNAAAACALFLWMAGVRQEVWRPTRRQV